MEEWLKRISENSEAVMKNPDGMAELINQLHTVPNIMP